MIKKVLIIYIEGTETPMPKQEKNLFNVSQSLRLWDLYFTELGFGEGKFKIFPKKFATESSFEKFLSIIDRSVKELHQSAPSGEKVDVKIVATGDHDELNDEITLKRTESIAEIIKNRYEAEVILERKRNFKIESLMSELVGEKVNKQILREKAGKEFPDLKELLKAFDVETDQMISNIVKSEHPLFSFIKSIKPEEESVTKSKSGEE